MQESRLRVHLPLDNLSDPEYRQLLPAGATRRSCNDILRKVQRANVGDHVFKHAVRCRHRCSCRRSIVSYYKIIDEVPVVHPMLNVVFSRSIFNATQIRSSLIAALIYVNKVIY